MIGSDRVAGAVTWMVANSYASGHPDTTYRPDNDITRAQITRKTCHIHAAPGTC